MLSNTVGLAYNGKKRENSKERCKSHVVLTTAVKLLLPTIYTFLSFQKQNAKRDTKTDLSQ